jgi:hypothetical protein
LGVEQWQLELLERFQTLSMQNALEASFFVYSLFFLEPFKVFWNLEMATGALKSQ